MTTVGVRELQRDASRLLRRVENGEHLVVTVHRRPVAELVPYLETRPAWRPVTELAALFPGVPDQAWDEDMKLVDGAAADPSEHGADR
ncbi:type II toxin-antitoxin system Phd/YefM family antitoxin [Cellulomonas sp. CW35]|uniref:type II toxin-antitoxin system prevent-host-death family antitoxin n=1 Tax=Cellulomonas sp. CW35 TaxID=3458249 RepID=UPI0022810099